MNKPLSPFQLLMSSLSSADCRSMRRAPSGSPLLSVTLLFSSLAFAVVLISSTNVWPEPRADRFAADGQILSSKPVLAGTVESLRGRAVAESAHNMRTLKTMSEVYVRDLIRTGPGSRMTLRLGMKTRLRLGEKTALRISEFVVNIGGEFDLSTGAIHFDRNAPAPDNRTFQIKSKYGLIAVRGTRFFAGLNRGRFAIFVENGSVEVTAADISVTLGPGEGTDITAPGNSPSKPKKWGAARIREALAAVGGK